MRKIVLVALSCLVAGLIAPPAHADPTPAPQDELIPAWDTPGPQRSTTYEDDPPATDSARAAAPAWRCFLFVSDPEFVRHNGRGHIKGIGRQWCTGAGYIPQGPRLTLQRYLGLGIWRNVRRTSIAWSRGHFAEMQYLWPCTGTGSEQYRWVVDGFAQGVRRARANAYSLNYRRVYC
ncbi:hypothetical protein SAMN05444920_11460 [Nonomuraea solani]|uniref:Peptidase inhibitor family I36 n=1 Tax=Nonomuraea solani TaxID=1144553 RepID=A0A1H6ESV9_9ACTN|nr:hypothetical protein [Nonomuraea solani]SEG99784.1 hypothetical protein SAMN05444920_11460 [Nonomuraea solani]